jgi:hypothetical protein
MRIRDFVAGEGQHEESWARDQKRKLSELSDTFELLVPQVRFPF